MEQFKPVVSSIKTNILHLIVAFVFASYTQTVSAALPLDATLTIDPGTITDIAASELPTAGSGSWFALGPTSGTSIVTNLTGKNHLKLNTLQPAISPDSPNIDKIWLFSAILGVHQTTVPVTILNDDGTGNVTLDFSGWDVSWSSIPSIPLGSGAHSGGIEGEASMTCANTCEYGDSYTLKYYATVPFGDAPFGGVQYAVQLEGIITTPALPSDATLTIDAGTVGDNVLLELPGTGNGSWFSMELTPGVLTITNIAGHEHLQLGVLQPAFSTGPEGIDEIWTFFGNQGVHLTTVPVTILSNDSIGTATLDFSGWGVSWNDIPVINLGTGQDSGVATVSCANTCEYGDSYTLNYAGFANPSGENVSGYSGVNYSLHLEGIVRSSLQIQATALMNASSCGVDSICRDDEMEAITGGILDKGFEVIGDYFDFSITTLPGGVEQVVLSLIPRKIPASAVYRKFSAGAWKNFDISTGDSFSSTKSVNGVCPGPGTSAYIAINKLVKGDDCIQLTISDGGPNDTDGSADGTIKDPGGVSVASSSNSNNSDSGGGYLLLVVAFAWLGMFGYARKRG